MSLSTVISYIIWKDTCTPKSTAALFTATKTWKKPKCPLTEEWIKKMWYNTHMYNTHTYMNNGIVSSVTQSCPTLCKPMDCSTPGFPVLYQLPELTQTHVHWVGDAIQPSHSLSSLSPPTLNLSQHLDLFQWVSSSHQVANVLELQLQHQFFQWIFRVDFL